MSSKEETRIEHLNKIIDTQARLAEADFDVNAFMDLVVNQMQILTPATGVVIELLENDNCLVYRAATGTVKKHIGLRLDLEKSFSGLCIKTGQILCSDDTEIDSRVNINACRLVEARSMVVAPLLNNGKAVGVLKILSRNPDAFSAADIQTLRLMAGLIGSALAHQIFYETANKLLIEKTQMFDHLKQAEEKLQYQAQHDYLTDLPNRALFTDKLLVSMGEARENKQILALMYLDIDHFKNINDNLGHAIGDALLQEFSKRLKDCLRPMDTIARFGGDEFVLLMPNLKSKEIAFQMAKEILNRTQDPYHLLNKHFKITTSIGLSFFKGDRISADALLSQADQALYAAKKSGRNTLDVFRPEIAKDLLETVY